MPPKERYNNPEYSLTNREKVQLAQRRPVQDKKSGNLSTETSGHKKNRFAFQADVRVMGMTTQAEVTKFIQEEKTGISGQGMHVSDRLRTMASNGSLPQSDGTTDALRKILHKK